MAARPEEAGVSATSFITPTGIFRGAQRVFLLAVYMMDARVASRERESGSVAPPFADKRGQRLGTSVSEGERTGRSQITRRGRHGWLISLSPGEESSRCRSLLLVLVSRRARVRQV